jgi:hypothetical protein
MLLVRALLLAAAALITFYLLVSAARNKRRLDRSVEEFREELEENQGPPPNPYLALAELYAEDERKNQEARKHKSR